LEGFRRLLEDHEKTDDAHGLLMKLSSERISECCKNAPDQTARLGAIYAQWVRSYGFNFESCDGITNRVEIFINNGSIAVRAECLLALLMMGTSHNRWYVERKFVGLCGPDMDEVCAKRLAIEVRADSNTVCMAVSHIEHSISISRSALHPLLVKTLSEICK
jgi:hypothetical protein